MRLSLPQPSIKYNYFILKVNQINMMSDRGYLIEKDEKKLADESKTHEERMALFAKKYEKKNEKGHLFYNKDDLNKDYIPRDERMEKFIDKEELYDKKDLIKIIHNKLIMKVYFSTKSNAKHLKNDILANNQHRLNVDILIISDEIPLGFFSPDTDPPKKSGVDIKILTDKQITFDTRKHSFSTKNMVKL